MSTMNISLPEAMKSYVDQQVSDRDYGSASEYIRELIRKDQGRQRLRTLLLEGATSSAALTADEDYFGQLRDRVHKLERQ